MSWDSVLFFLLTLCVASIGAFLVSRIKKLPAAEMIGAILAVAVFNVSTGHAIFPLQLKILTQSAAGAIVGVKIDKAGLLDLKRILVGSLVFIFFIILLSSGMGFFLSEVSDMSLITALFCCAPGGTMEMTLAASDIGGDPSKVVTFQIFRLLFVIGFFPSLFTAIKRLLKRIKRIQPHLSVSVDEKMELSFQGEIQPDRKAMLLTSVLVLAAGYVGYYTRIPAGAIIFSLIASMLLNFKTGKAQLPKMALPIARTFSGALVGCTVTYSDILSLRDCAWLILLMIVGYLFMTLICGTLFSLTCKVDLMTALCSLCPGGATDIALMTGDIGADQAKVAVIQVLRLILTIVCFPLISMLISKFF